MMDEHEIGAMIEAAPGGMGASVALAALDKHRMGSSTSGEAHFCNTCTGYGEYGPDVYPCETLQAVLDALGEGVPQIADRMGEWRAGLQAADEHLRSITGPQGPTGAMGMTGPPGPPGVVDPEMIRVEVQRQLAAAGFAPLGQGDAS